MLLIQHQLPVMCEICCELSWSRTICQLSEHVHYSICVSVSHLRRLKKCKTPTFISSDLWPQHPGMNPLNDKICSEMQQQVYLRKKSVTWTDRHYGLLAGMALTYIRFISKPADEWCKCLQMCVHVKRRLSILLQIIHMYILICWFGEN